MLKVFNEVWEHEFVECALISLVLKLSRFLKLNLVAKKLMRCSLRLREARHL